LTFTVYKNISILELPRRSLEVPQEILYGRGVWETKNLKQSEKFKIPSKYFKHLLEFYNNLAVTEFPSQLSALSGL
jgi:hypothetical protein